MDQIAPDPISVGVKVAMLFLKSLSGLAEGIVLGTLQGTVLRRLYPRLSLFAWVGLTALLAIFGWAVGSAIPIFGSFSDQDQSEPPLLLTLAFASLFGLIVGALFGGIQALALSRAAHNSHWWTIVNAVGWAIALPVIYLAASLPNEFSTIWQVAAAGLASGIVAGVLLGAVTGLAFWRMEPK
jgi:MFS family permease